MDISALRRLRQVEGENRRFKQLMTDLNTLQEVIRKNL